MALGILDHTGQVNIQPGTAAAIGIAKQLRLVTALELLEQMGDRAALGNGFQTGFSAEIQAVQVNLSPIR